jgi:hypothetical protein
MRRDLRLLYVGPLSPGGTCLQRMNVLRELGHEIIPLDTDAYTQGLGRFANWLQYRACWSPGIGRLNRQFVQTVHDAQPDIVWVDIGLFIHPESLHQLKGKSRLIHYNPDDPFGWRIFLKAIPEYDLHFVARDANVDEYRKAGAQNVLRHHWAYDRNLHRPVDVDAETRTRLGGTIGFIGDWEARRETSVQYLADHGQPVRIWGPNWQRHVQHPQLRIEPQGVWSETYTRAVCSFDINLGFLRKKNRDKSTQRSVEIPACGGFLLAERTEEHQAMFEEGKEAEFFSSDEELLEKVRYYAAHAGQRRQIASAGMVRCHASGYSYHDRLSRMIQQALDLQS